MSVWKKLEAVQDKTIDISKIGISKSENTSQPPLKSPLKSILQKAFPCGYILSSDKRPELTVPQHICIQMQQKLGITVYYSGEWHKLIKWFSDNIIYEINRDDLKEEDDKHLWNIIYRMSNFDTHRPPQKLYNSYMQMNMIIKNYKNYRRSNDLPNFVFLKETPIGLTITDTDTYNHKNNVVVYLERFQTIPQIDGLKLLHLFPDPEDMGIETLELLDILDNKLSREDRYNISINLRKWLVLNPGKLSIGGSIGTSTTKMWQVPINHTICICKNCHKMLSDIHFRDFLSGETHKTILAEKKSYDSVDRKNFHLKHNPILLGNGETYETLPEERLKKVIKENLYILCTNCNHKISMQSLITKFNQIYYDTNTIKAISRKLVIRTLEKQFPKIACMVCLDDDVSIGNIYNPSMCEHNPCMCFPCKQELTLAGLPKKGKLIQNSNYQCPCCFKFDIKIMLGSINVANSIYNSDFIMFLEKGGVQSGYSARFCTRCIFPFQEKNSCGAESGEMSLFCPPCTEMIMQLNLSTRQYVSCPCCDVMLQRLDYTCDLMECKNCDNQFCYGCNYIFIYGAEVDWVCTCLIPGTNPREYKDPSFTSCKTKFKNSIKERLERMLYNILQNMRDRSVPSYVRASRRTRTRTTAVADIADIADIREQFRIAEEIGDNDNVLLNRLALLN
jgi:hypothetical protein